MGKKKKEKVEFRYYELPGEASFLARQGEEWKLVYGVNVRTNHFHNLLEIGCCHYGRGSLVLGEEHCPFEGGMLTIIPPGYLHNTISQEQVEAYWEYLFVDTERFFKELYPDNPQSAKRLAKQVHKGAVLLKEAEEPGLFALVKQMLKECLEKKEWYLESVKGMLLSLLIAGTRGTGVTQEKEHSVRKGNTQITPALFYISDHYSTELKIGELARVCHMSETHFRRVFVQSMNMTPVEYRNLVRVHMACELLNKTDGTMEEIAQKAGFETVSTFNRNFKKLVGTSPYQWKINPENYGRQLKQFRISAYPGW